ncbi:ABC transporter ATP-binding protein [Acidocella sp.]|uniref:ABC transporter ATP-binding protein n=1 Tax=Acidocella sp. TaxID=50710 RepID=UPI00263210C6|nr:ABC transporter ATP-binding protein [Acidocella sp.]
MTDTKPHHCIEIHAVDKIFGAGTEGHKALDGVSLDIYDKEFFTLLGPSGCGKTTLLRMLAGFETPTRGEIRLHGRPVANLPPRARPVNMVFQNYALFPHLTVTQNIAFGLEMLGWKKERIAARVTAMLALVRLEAFRSRKPAQLSGGQQQRVALARALAPQPELLLLDEPLSALDLKLRKEMQGELKRLQRETGITFVLVTHDQEEALAMSDRLAVMNKGRVLQTGTPDEIYHRPVSRFVADFIGEANLIPGAALHRDGIFAVRPEQVTLASTPAGPARLEGEVREAVFLSADTMYEIAVPQGSEILTIRARLRRSAAEARPGQTVRLHWPDEAEWQLDE